MFEPTERSMPAVSSTKVMPMAAMPMKAACLTMLARLSGARKRGAGGRKEEDGDEDEQRRVAEGEVGEPGHAALYRRGPASGGIEPPLGRVGGTPTGAARAVGRMLCARVRRGSSV